MIRLENQYLAGQQKISELIDLGKRQVALATIRSTEVMKRRYIHFEGKWDCVLAQKAWFIHGELRCSLAFIHSNNKSECITNHSSMANLGFKIQTIVDMDHDFEDQCIIDVDGFESIRSTKPYATLLTLMSEGYCVDIARELVKWLNLDFDITESFDYHLLEMKSRHNTLLRFERSVNSHSWKGHIAPTAYPLWKSDLKKWIASGGRIELLNDHVFIETLYELTKEKSWKIKDPRYIIEGKFAKWKLIKELESEYRKKSVDFYGKILYFLLKDLVSEFNKKGTSSY